MMRTLCTAIVIGLLTISVAVALAQNTTVELDPMHAKSLSGVVVDGAGAFVPNATISLIDCPVSADGHKFGDQAIISTQSDTRGNFSLDPRGYKKPYCLRVSSPGFNPLQFRVIMSHFAGRMHLVLPVAT